MFQGTLIVCSHNTLSFETYSLDKLIVMMSQLIFNKGISGKKNKNESMYC